MIITIDNLKIYFGIYFAANPYKYFQRRVASISEASYNYDTLE